MQPPFSSGGARRLFRPALSAGLALALLPCVGTRLTAADPAIPATPTPAAPAPAVEKIPALLQDLLAFRETRSVLYVAAHPDDENTLLLAHLALGKRYRTAYLSLTRGDGGQNESGPEFGAKLGLARTQELLAARRLDGGQQFFTRALDFGYSKDVNETLRIWNHQAVLSDVVRVIREFQPDVIITRFSPEPGGTHGHHTASAVLAQEAFDLAGDPKAFPEQLDHLKTWQPKRLLHNLGWWTPKGPQTQPLLTVDVGGNDPVSGQPLAGIADQSRAMHKTQGLGFFGKRPVEAPRPENFLLLKGAPVSTDLLEGVDGTWARYPGGAALIPLLDEVISHFDASHPEASVPKLLEVRQRLQSLDTTLPALAAKAQQLDRLLVHCLGLRATSTVSSADVAPGDTFAVENTVTVAAGYPVTWTGLRYPATKAHQDVNLPLTPGAAASRNDTVTLSRDAEPTQPYWLRHEPAAGIFQVDTPDLIGRPVNPPAFPVEFVFSLGGQTLTVSTEPHQHLPSAPEAQQEKPLAIVTPASISFDTNVQRFSPGEEREVSFTLTASRGGLGGIAGLTVPEGWILTGKPKPFVLQKAGDRTTVSFRVKAPEGTSTALLEAYIDLGGKRFSYERLSFSYPHIPEQRLQPPATLRVFSAPLAVTAKHVGYLPGAGDATVEALQQLGCDVRLLSDQDLTPNGLAGLDAVVVGVRAFNERAGLAEHLPGLWSYAEAGGTVILQYNRPNGLKATSFGPFALSIAGDAPKLRVTDETAPVTFLAPTHPALTTPNALNASDFDGWVQERGAYFPSTWDEAHYTALLAMADPGEAPLKSSLLIARHGKGHLVYTGLSFFRQLPAGVPGAYRLFANLVSLKP